MDANVEDFEIVKRLKKFFAENEKKIPDIDANPQIIEVQQNAANDLFMIKEEAVKGSTG